jgi:hypothetical protein
MGHPRARAGAAADKAWTCVCRWRVSSGRARRRRAGHMARCPAPSPRLPGRLSDLQSQPDIPPSPRGSGGSNSGHRAQLTTGEPHARVTTTVAPPQWWVSGTGVNPGRRRSASVAGAPGRAGRADPGVRSSRTRSSAERGCSRCRARNSASIGLHVPSQSPTGRLGAPSWWQHDRAAAGHRRDRRGSCAGIGLARR